MKLIRNRTHPRHLRGVTFLELALVIGMMLALISILFVAARTWRAGSDRSKCIINQRTIQLGVRSFQNMYGYAHGSGLQAGEGTTSIVEALRDREFINQRLYDSATGTRTCPAGGSYTVPDPTVFPEEGTLFMACSFADTRRHVPENSDSW